MPLNIYCNSILIYTLLFKNDINKMSTSRVYKCIHVHSFASVLNIEIRVDKLKLRRMIFQE